MPRRSSTGQGSGKKARKAKGQADSVEHHEIDDDLFMLGGGGEGGGRGERRTSSRVVGGQSSGGTDQDAIALAKSFYHGPQKNQMVLNVEGRGSCTVFALGASIGLNVKHVVESGDSLGNQIGTVHANDRVIDLWFYFALARSRPCMITTKADRLCNIRVAFNGSPINLYIRWAVCRRELPKGNGLSASG